MVLADFPDRRSKSSERNCAAGDVVKILGIDGGIASTGWAVIEVNDAGNRSEKPTGKIVAAGARTFEAPETDKERTPKNQIRRLYRGQRRVMNRRRQRMNTIRELFAAHSLLRNANKDALRAPNFDPWQLRADGLDRLLAPQEFAVTLGHIARHRGFRSNAKRDRGANASDDSSKMLNAIDTTRERLARWRTVGEMLARDPYFSIKRRNRTGDFTRSVLRNDQAYEVEALFDAQRRFGSLHATLELQTTFANTAFSQRPLQSSENLVGNCPFEPEERRAAKRSPSFELFRLLARLSSLRLITGRTERALAAEEVEKASSTFCKTPSLKFQAIRKLLDLDVNTRFSGISSDDENRDVVARLGGAAEGTSALRKVVCEAVGEIEWQSLIARADALDRVSAALTFREEPDDIRRGIVDAGVTPEICHALMTGLENGAFTKFKGAGHISAKAARAMIPAMRRGLGYSEAAEEAGYDHTARPATEIADIGSPVARKALSEMLKQVIAIDQVHGPFDRIHVEMARDVGKSIEERGRIEKGIKDRTADKDRARQDLKQLLNIENVSAEDLLRYELWKEQAGKSLYTDAPIPIAAVLATDNSVQVDHVLPWSRFGDDSFINKTLCLAGEDQAKAGRTPYEWFNAEKKPEAWDELVARVEAATIRGRKKRNLLLKDASSVEEKFRERNLNDTRYATRVLLDELKRRYPAEEGSRRVFARPGELTSKLRRAWGINGLKKSPTGERLSDDRHHALDAIVVAATSEAQLNRLTQVFKEAERRGLSRDFSGLAEPWEGFRDEAAAHYASVTVSRAEVRRARGKAHDATIKQIREVDGARVVFERKPIDKLTEADLDKIPVPEPYGKVSDPMKLHTEMVTSLRTWINNGKPKADEHLPRSPKGDIIRKVRVRTKDKVAVNVRGGTADNQPMVRVDVFEKFNSNGRQEHFLVPIYPHEIAECATPPNKAIQRNRERHAWPDMDSTFKFLWSIYPMSLIKLTKPAGDPIVGYFRGVSANTGAVIVSPMNDTSASAIQEGIGVKQLIEFQKLSIDRLGNVSEVGPEVRTWRGKACT
jgi:CRISPR-associated endonuclease Csn1